MSLDEKMPLREGQLSSPSQSTTAVNADAAALKKSKRRPKKAEEGMVAALCTWIVDHQIGIAVNLLMLLTLAHMSFPKARQHTRKFFALAYYNEATGRYAVGPEDAYSLIFWITVFTGLRIVIMQYIMGPMAELVGITKPKEKTRLAEQAWSLIYYTASFSLGMYVMYQSNYWMTLEHIWEGWPDREMDGLLKWYYLVEFASWLQQIFVLNIEERRKDHYQMLTHHFITCGLMLTSYAYRHVRIGHVILCIMDSVDVVLPLAKMLKYMKYQKACDIAFVAFILVWVVSRHGFFMIALRSVHTGLGTEVIKACYSGQNGNLEGPFELPAGYGWLISPFIDPAGIICHTQGIANMFVGMLVLLQCLLLIWFGMIVRLVIKVLKGKIADDPRSDDESDEMEMEDVEDTAYERVTAEDLQRKHEQRQEKANKSTAASHRAPRSPGTASGVSLPSDRKELLGRIGCDKGN